MKGQKKQAEQSTTIKLEIVEMSTDRVVRTIDTGTTSERIAEKVLRGLLINMNTERFFVREVGGKS